MRKQKVIVIDDDQGILDAFQVMLESEDYQVQTSTCPEFLFEITQDDQLPSLIIMDVLLSGIDGRDICVKLKENSTTRHIPIIMISADPSVVNGINECGANDYLKKPFEMDELLEKITKYVHQ